MAKEVVAEKTESKKQQYRLVEITVDENLTKIRRLVPIETDEDDLPDGATVYSEEETKLMLLRQNKPDIILPGHQVRLRPTADDPVPDDLIMGTVEGKTRTGLWRVKWDNGTISRHKDIELARIY